MLDVNSLANPLAKGVASVIKSNVAKLMEERGVTVLTLSHETGLATETITRARGDKIAKCQLETLEKIGVVLGVQLKDLFEEVTS
jgi:DNA-binding Xre family transcriptional regulator